MRRFRRSRRRLRWLRQPGAVRLEQRGDAAPLEEETFGLAAVAQARGSAACACVRALGGESFCLGHRDARRGGHGGCALNPARWINRAAVRPQLLARGRAVAKTSAATGAVHSTLPAGLSGLRCVLSSWCAAGQLLRTRVLATRPVRSTPPGGLSGLRCVLSPSSGSKLAVCTARLPQHGAQLCHEDLQALWLAGPRLDFPASKANEAHLSFAALASELGHVLVARGRGA